jgi:RecA/RadA recombinase
MPRRPIAEITKEIQKLRARANKSAKGAPVIESIENVPNTYFLRRPCGIMPLDIDTGGGLPAGGLCYISGPDNAGKTFLNYKYIAMNQRLLGNRSSIALALSEGPPDHWFMRKCGVRVAIPEKMIEEESLYRKERNEKPFSKEEIAELRSQTGHIEILRHQTGEKLLQTVVEAVECKAFDIVGLDSVSALISENEAKKDLDENSQAQAVANVLTRFFQHYLTQTTGFHGMNETTVIFTAQARSNKKKSEAAAHLARYMKDWTTQGAWAARHGKLIDITVWSGQKEKVETTLDGGLESKDQTKRVAVGKDICWEITKGKAGTHDGIAGEIPFSYATLTDDHRSIIMSGMRAGCIKEKDGLFTVFRKSTGEAFEGMSDLAGPERLIEIMKEDFEVELFIRREVLAASGIRCAYR